MGTRENAARIVSRAPSGGTPIDRLRWLAGLESELTPEVAKHSTQVSRIAGQIARSLGMSSDEINDIKASARWHDIGKIAVPSEIQRKPGVFTADEYAEMKLHAEVGLDLLGPGFPPDFEASVVYHHERYDGYGYYGMTGESIPFTARVVAIADVAEALIAHDRPYKGPMSEVDAILLMTADVASPGFGRRAFDPYVMRQFVAMRLEDPRFEPTPLQRKFLADYAKSPPMSDLTSALVGNDGWIVKETGERLLYSFGQNGSAKRLEMIVGRTGIETFRRERTAKSVEAPSHTL